MFFIILTILLVTFYFYSSYSYDYWRKRNIKHEATIPIFGNHFLQFFGFRNMIYTARKLYNKYPKELVVGYYQGSTPVLVVRDPDIVRNVLSADFAHFYKRGLSRNVEKEPLLKNIFHSDDDVWKLAKHISTPAFTLSKIKAMFPLVIECTEKLEILVKDIIAKGGECNMRDIMARFTIDFICASGLGIESGAINNTSALFVNIGKRIFKCSFTDVLVLGIWDLFPKIRDKFGYIDDSISNKLFEIVHEIIKQRNYKPSGRNDYIDILLELFKKEKVVGESIEHKHQDGTPKEVEIEVDEQFIAAQIYMFFAAGFETSSLSISCSLHYLAFHPTMQQKVQDEIDRVLLKYDGKLCYDSVAEMTLLSNVVNETLRMFPAAGYLSRICTKTYEIPKLGITIDPGVRLVIPVQGLHHDKQYFDNPDSFDPERFYTEKIINRHKYVFLPYGAGPRACIGARLGHMQSLAGIAAVLRKFTVSPTINSEENFKDNPRMNIVQAPLNGLPLKLTYRKKET